MFWFIGSGILFSSLRDTRGGQAIVSILIAALIPCMPAALIGAFFYQDLDELYLNFLRVTLLLMIFFALWVVLDPPDYLRCAALGDRALAAMGGLIASIVLVVFLALSFFISIQVAGPRGIVAGTDSPTADVFLESRPSNPAARLGVVKIGDVVNCSSNSRLGAYGVYCDAQHLRFNEDATDELVLAMRARSEPLLLAIGATNLLAALILIIRPSGHSEMVSPNQSTPAPSGNAIGGVGRVVGNALLFALTWFAYFIPISLVTQIWAGSSVSEGAGGGLEELLRWVALFGILGFMVVIVANFVNSQQGGRGALFNSEVRDRGLTGFAVAAVASFVWFVSHAPPKPGWWFGGPLGALLGVMYGLYSEHISRKS